MVIQNPYGSPLPADLELFITERVSSGEFASPTDVIIAGVRALRERQAEIADMRARIEEGWEGARRGEFVDGEEAFAQLDLKIAELEEPKRRERAG